MTSALIGYTGFIGGNLKKQTEFTDFYNSTNINDIRGKTYDLIVSAATSSLRWKADLEPEKDWEAIKKLTDPLRDATTKQFILISTVDVYPKPIGVNEESKITIQRPNGYGLNRYKLEMFVKENFAKTVCIRLPQTFGEGIKKNFIFDLIYSNALDFTHKDSKFQWYNLKNLWKDISAIMENNLEHANLAVEPLSCLEIAKYTIALNFNNVTKKPPLSYDMHTKYANLFDSKGNYIYYKEETLRELKIFIQNFRKNL